MSDQPGARNNTSTVVRRKPIAQVMTKDVVTVTRDGTLAVICQLMGTHGVGSIIVVDGHRPIGIITERDLVNRVLLDHNPKKPFRAKEIMSTKLFTISSESKIIDVIHLMRKHGCRHVPVVDDDGNLVGIVTQSDIIREMEVE